MNTVQGKNVVVVGGLQGVGLKLTKNLLNRRVKNLYIIDVCENQGALQDLRNKCQNTRMFFKRIDEFKFNSEIQKTVQDITLKMDKIDLFVNAMEMMVEKDLQRTMDMNTKIYLNTMMAARNVMDRNKGGRGGKIVNVLSNMNLKNMELKKYGCDTDCNDQQHLINKQMLMSLTEAFGQDEFFQQTGVDVMCMMPVMDKNMARRNYEWVRKVGLEKMVNDCTTSNNRWENDNMFGMNVFDEDTDDECDQDRYQNRMDNDDYGNIRRMLNVLCDKMVRGMEQGQNGNKLVVGLKGMKNIQKQGLMSRL